jgi:hypothetical protein
MRVPVVARGSLGESGFLCQCDERIQMLMALRAG